MIREKLEELRKEGENEVKLKNTGVELVKQYINGDLEDKREIQDRIMKAEEEIENDGQDAVSLTDPEARFMKNKKKHTELSYNYQITVDQKTGLILAASLS